MQVPRSPPLKHTIVYTCVCGWSAYPLPRLDPKVSSRLARYDDVIRPISVLPRAPPTVSPPLLTLSQVREIVRWKYFSSPHISSTTDFW